MSAVLIDTNTISISDFTGTLSELVTLVNIVLPSTASDDGSGSYIFNSSLIFENNVSLSDYKRTVTFNGEYFIFKNNCILQFSVFMNYGTSYSSYNGCTINMPNLVLLGSYTEDAGSFIGGNSTIDAMGEWRILGPMAKLILAGANVSCYGTYKGTNSIISSVAYRAISSANGVLTPVGDGGVNINTRIQGDVVLDEVSNASSAMVIDSSTSDIIWEYGVIDNYRDLISIVDSGAYNGTIQFLGTEIINGYTVNSTDDNQHDIYHKYRFSGTLYNAEGAVLPNYSIVITNRLGEVEQNILTDENGGFDTWLIYYRDLSNAVRVGEYLTPHTVVVDGQLTFKVNMANNKENIPLFLYGVTVGEVVVDEKDAEIIDLIEEFKNLFIESDTSNKDYLHTITTALSEKIKDVTTTVKSGQGVTVTI